MDKVVCVTGASGFVASWLVKILLQRGYCVRGVVRSLEDKQKISHLEGLEGAKERLTLVKGNLLDYESLFHAINGCSGVFHTACPVPSHTSTNPEVEVLDPAIKGTLNVLKACVSAKIKRVIMTSSISAAYVDPKRPPKKVVDESFWSDENFLRENKHWYMLGKTLGEKEAWTFSKENNLDLVVILPTLTLGPLLQSTINSSTLAILKLLNDSVLDVGKLLYMPYPLHVFEGEASITLASNSMAEYAFSSTDSYEDNSVGVVDVRDVALAHVLTYETPSSSGRYICNNIAIKRSLIVETLRKLYPDCVLPKRCIESEMPEFLMSEFSKQKLQELGLSFTPFEQTLKDTVESLKMKGLLQI